MAYRTVPGKSVLTQHISVMPNRCVPGAPLNVIRYSTQCKLSSVGNNEGRRMRRPLLLTCHLSGWTLLCSWKECLLRMLLSEPCCFPPLTWQCKVSHFHPASGFHSSYRMLSKCNKTTVVYNCYCIDCGQKERKKIRGGLGSSAVLLLLCCGQRGCPRPSGSSVSSPLIERCTASCAH